VQRLTPDPAETTVEQQLDGYRPWEQPGEERPHVAMNFAATLDGRATIEGRSGQIGSDNDTAMLVGLRTRFDAVMIGAGTMRAERYGRPVSDPAKREARKRLGLPHDPLMVIVSGRLDLPWDAPLFSEAGRVLVFTAASMALPTPPHSMLNPGAHGFSEVLYAFTSASNNNGSAFAGLNANTDWFNTMTGLAMLLGRFLPMVFVLALAGSLAGQRPVPATAGTLRTEKPLFAGLLVGAVLIITGLTYFPALALGPLAEGLAS